MNALSTYLLLLFVQSVQMVTSDWLVVLHLMRDVWRFAKMQPGELCVTIAGITLMLLLLAGSLDSLEQVCFSDSSFDHVLNMSLVSFHIKKTAK